jgi:hypothetical protein
VARGIFFFWVLVVVICAFFKDWLLQTLKIQQTATLAITLGLLLAQLVSPFRSRAPSRNTKIRPARLVHHAERCWSLRGHFRFAKAIPGKRGDCFGGGVVRTWIGGGSRSVALSQNIFFPGKGTVRLAPMAGGERFR